MNAALPRRSREAHDPAMRATARGGPKTRQGKAKASANAATHGLTGRFLVLGSERVEDYAEHVSSTLNSIHPHAPAERTAAVLLADLTWRLQRLHRLEQHHFRSSLEEKMKKTAPVTTLALVQRALVAVNALIKAVDATANPPTSREGLGAFLAGCNGVTAIIEEAGVLPADARRELEDKIAALEASAGTSAVTEAFKALGGAARAIASRLDLATKKSGREIKKLRKRLEDTVLLTDDSESRKLARYRDQLQKSVVSQLDILEGLQRVRGRRGQRRGSFGKADPAVRLRVVK